MRRAELLESVRSLGRAFRARGMEEHAQKLRLYYLALRRDLLPISAKLEVRWTPELVREWMQVLRLPPYEAALPTRRPGAGCPRCPRQGSSQPTVRTELVFPEGARMRCDACGSVWLEVSERG